MAGEIGLSKKLALSELALPRHGWIVETLWAQRGPFLVDEFRKLHIPQEEMEMLDLLHAALMIPIFIVNQLRQSAAVGGNNWSTSSQCF